MYTVQRRGNKLEEAQVIFTVIFTAMIYPNTTLPLSWYLFSVCNNHSMTRRTEGGASVDGNLCNLKNLNGLADNMDIKG